MTAVPSPARVPARLPVPCWAPPAFGAPRGTGPLVRVLPVRRSCTRRCALGFGNVRDWGAETDLFPCPHPSGNDTSRRDTLLPASPADCSPGTKKSPRNRRRMLSQSSCIRSKGGAGSREKHMCLSCCHHNVQFFACTFVYNLAASRAK